jgi:hypothetical protein
MATHRDNPAPAKPWTKKATDWKDRKRPALAGDLGIGSSYISSLIHGGRRTPTGKIDGILALAAKDGYDLTPADLGRPDLN